MTPDITEVFAVKDRDGVTFYLDEALRQPLRRWERWRSDLPGPRQRYHHINGRCFKLKWLKF